MKVYSLVPVQTEKSAFSGFEYVLVGGYLFSASRAGSLELPPTCS